MILKDIDNDITYKYKQWNSSFLFLSIFISFTLFLFCCCFDLLPWLRLDGEWWWIWVLTENIFLVLNYREKLFSITTIIFLFSFILSWVDAKFYSTFMIKLFLSFNLLLWWINLIDFWMLKQLYVTWFFLIYIYMSWVYSVYLYLYIYTWILCTNILLMIFLSSWGIFSIVFINIFVFVINLRLLFYNGCLFLDILLASALFMIIFYIGVFNKMSAPPPPPLFLKNIGSIKVIYSFFSDW